MDEEAPAGSAGVDRGTATLGGALIGLLAVLLFLTVHAVIIEPIWRDGILPGLAIGVVGGAVIGHVYRRIRERLPGFPALRGAMFGILVASVLLPFLLAGYARTTGAPLHVVVLALGGFLLMTLLVVAYGVTRPGEDWNVAFRDRGLLLLFGAFFVNAYPATFLFFLPELVDPELGAQPSPFPIAILLVLIEVLAALVLEGLYNWRDPRSYEQRHQREAHILDRLA